MSNDAYWNQGQDMLNTLGDLASEDMERELTKEMSVRDHINDLYEKVIVLQDEVLRLNKELSRVRGTANRASDTASRLANGGSFL